jgi:hypothetical protein
MSLFSTRSILIVSTLMALSTAAPAFSKQPVPFVGCPADGMTGHVDPPKGADRLYDIDAATAAGLAYYQAADSIGVLAPRGWTCLFVFGSDGESLRVAPSGDLHGSPPLLDGPAVVLVTWSGETSGRSQVAKYSARLFPKIARAFIDEVISFGFEPAANFRLKPYPVDKLVYKTARMVEFTTPANRMGLGTSDALKKSGEPVCGIAALVDTTSPGTPDFVMLTVRLPPSQAKLTDAILKAAE